MRKSFAIVAIAGIAAAASAQSTYSTSATSSAEIRPTGPREFSGDVNMAFWNAEPSSEGNFATVGYMQFNSSSIKAQFDSEYGAGNWEITDVQFSLYQDPAGFTSNFATVDFFWGANDPTMTLPGLSGYNFANALSQIGAQEIVSNYQFVKGALGTNDVIDIFSTTTNPAHATLTADIMAGGIITLASRSDLGNASWAGAGPINGQPLPGLIVTAEEVPAPAVAGVFGVAGLAAARRRRA